jgi:YNFM family putative membrane transporter
VPAIAGEYRATAGTVGPTITAFTLAYGLCQLFWGPVGDRFGKYRVVALACLLSAATTSAAAFAGSLAMLAGLRLLSGVTAAIIPLSMAFIGDPTWPTSSARRRSPASCRARSWA